MTALSGRAILIAAMFVLGCPSDDAVGYSSLSINIHNDIRVLQFAARMYREDFGRYPVTDADSTWYQKLVADEYVLPNLSYTTTDGSLPLGPYGSLIIYEVPGGAYAPLQDSRLPILRWVGANGIDDQGRGDDIDLRYGVNYGYYFKAGYPDALGWGILGSLLTIMLLRPFFSNFARWKTRISIFILWTGSWATLVGITGHPFNYYLCSDTYEYFTFLGAMGIFYGLVGCTIIGIGYLYTSYKSSNIIEAGLCIECQYDLRGSLGPKCPECGTSSMAGNYE